ncbi:hypothetical protein scyTo_0003487 [Scyliorhinus torazame]|uniref:Integrase catalytic domain-containing protein n=1 Tax=Scyliorhinus torazame TaxID=75743 RepID=A0A401PMP4_SCYTO|nr:hypothetical protein [Scyliorhinus torazame]
MCIDRGIKLEHSTPLHPQSSGSVERRNQDVKLCMTKLLMTRGRSWVKLVPEVQLTVNNLPLNRVGPEKHIPPYVLMFKVQMNTAQQASEGVIPQHNPELSQEMIGLLSQMQPPKPPVVTTRSLILGTITVSLTTMQTFDLNSNMGQDLNCTELNDNDNNNRQNRHLLSLEELNSTVSVPSETPVQRSWDKDGIIAYTDLHPTVRAAGTIIVPHTLVRDTDVISAQLMLKEYRHKLDLQKTVAFAIRQLKLTSPQLKLARFTEPEEDILQYARCYIVTLPEARPPVTLKADQSWELNMEIEKFFNYDPRSSNSIISDPQATDNSEAESRLAEKVILKLTSYKIAPQIGCTPEQALKILTMEKETGQQIPFNPICTLWAGGYANCLQTRHNYPNTMTLAELLQTDTFRVTYPDDGKWMVCLERIVSLRGQEDVHKIIRQADTQNSQEIFSVLSEWENIVYAKDARDENRLIDQFKKGFKKFSLCHGWEQNQTPYPSAYEYTEAKFSNHTLKMVCVEVSHEI